MRSVTDRLKPLVPPMLRPAAKTVYRALNGTHSRSIVERRMHRRARRRPPLTYTEKIRYKMAFDRRPILTRLADKVAVREYVADRVGPQYLSTAYAVTDDPRDVPWSALPREYVCKVNHASGGMVIVWEGADPGGDLPADPRVGWERLLVHPDRLDHDRLIGVLSHWLDSDYSWFPGKPMVEWAYAGVKPAVLVEELLLEGGALPRDLKFTVIHGTVIWIQVDSARFGEHRQDLMSVDWHRLPVTYGPTPRSDTLPARPTRLEQMVEVAETLAAGLDSVRVDLYEVEGRVVFGEMTHYPALGGDRVKPEVFDVEWGRDWVCDVRS